MKTLIVYGTNSGGTFRASELIRDVLVDQGHTVTLQPAKTTDPNDLGTFDLVILGSCTWDYFKGQERREGWPQEHMVELQDKLLQANKIFPGHRFAVFGLGDSSYTVFCGAVDHLIQLVNDLGGELIGEPLRIDGFFFHPEENEQRLRDWATTVAAAAAAS